MTITQRQRDILEFIKEYSRKHPFPPTVREIGHGVGMKSASTVAGHLGRLRTKGIVDWEDSSPRTIHVLKESV